MKASLCCSSKERIKELKDLYESVYNTEAPDLQIGDYIDIPLKLMVEGWKDAKDAKDDKGR